MNVRATATIASQPSKNDKSPLRIPGPLKHAGEARAETELLKEARGYVAAQPGVRFLADVLSALHAPMQPLRNARAFYGAFGPRQMMQAFGERAELRVRLVRAMTGGPPALLRRIVPADLATQIELLVAEDLPPAERVLRAEEDRNLSVMDLYLKYLEPADLAAYLPPSAIWQYESQDEWWRHDGAAHRTLMAAELKSIRKHGVLGDGEILDMIGDETLEMHLPLPVRTALRTAARKAASEGKPFRDSDMFHSRRSPDGKRDFSDELAESLSLGTLRQVVTRAAEVLGLAAVAVAPPAPEERTPEPVQKPRSTTPTPISTPIMTRPLAVAVQPTPTPTPTPTRADTDARSAGGVRQGRPGELQGGADRRTRVRRGEPGGRRQLAAAEQARLASSLRFARV